MGTTHGLSVRSGFAYVTKRNCRTQAVLGVGKDTDKQATQGTPEVKFMGSVSPPRLPHPVLAFDLALDPNVNGRAKTRYLVRARFDGS